MPSRHADLNIDLGELPEEPAELFELAHRVNIACGGHAGDEASMREACERAGKSGALIGAHPSFPDRDHFGRQHLALPLDALATAVQSQCVALCEIAASLNLKVSHLKLHGALYHSANKDSAMAHAVLAAALDALGPIAIVGPPDGEWHRAVVEKGIAYLAEGFADRGYAPDGTLLTRGTPGALLTDPALATAQAQSLLRAGRCDTLCVHSDTPNAVAIARAVRYLLDVN